MMGDTDRPDTIVDGTKELNTIATITLGIFKVIEHGLRPRRHPSPEPAVTLALTFRATATVGPARRDAERRNKNELTTSLTS